jgi:hypothetical protein
MQVNKSRENNMTFSANDPRVTGIKRIADRMNNPICYQDVLNGSICKGSAFKENVL